MGLQQFERRLERLVEGVFTKAFRSGLEPVEIGRRLTRELDDHRTIGVTGTLVPNHITVYVAEQDHERFASFAEALVRDLSDLARAHAREEGYRFVGPVTVEVATGDGLRPGEVAFASDIVAGDGGQVGTLVLADGRRLPIGDRPVGIGRLPECEIALSDPRVSRRHAEVHRDPDGFRVVDLGSTNGTLVNGVPVHEHRLADGDEVRVGETSIRFEAG